MTGGLRVARLEVFGPYYVQRPRTDRVVLLVTDGTPTCDADRLDDEAAALKAMGVRIVGVGVTNKVRQSVASSG